jgi:hypothetical protein
MSVPGDCQEVRQKMQEIVGLVRKSCTLWPSGKTQAPFSYLLNLMKHHPTWNNRLSEILGFRIEKKNRPRPYLLLKMQRLQKNQRKRWFVTSWRKCIPSNNKKHTSTITLNTAAPTTIEIESKIDSDHTNSSSNQTSDTISQELLTRAMRQAIQRQIGAFRRRNKSAKCETCQVTHGIFHVDHIVPFKTIQAEFLSKHNTWPVPQRFVPAKRCGVQIHTSGKQFKLSWQKYHRQHAKLQWLCEPCNLRKSDKLVINIANCV